MSARQLAFRNLASHINTCVIRIRLLRTSRAIPRRIKTYLCNCYENVTLICGYHFARSLSIGYRVLDIHKIALRRLLFSLEGLNGPVNRPRNAFLAHHAWGDTM